MITHRITIARALAAIAFPVAAWAQDQNAITIRVTVVSATTRNPVPGATLRLRTIPAAAVLTDSLGRAAFVGVPRRMEAIEATHAEYESRAEVLLLGAGTFDNVSLTLPMKPRAVRRLDTVSVVAEAPSKAAGFDARRTIGRGHLIDRREIDRVNPRATTELLRRVPGLRVETRGSQVRIRSRRAGDCEMLVYLDGAPVFNETTPMLSRGTRTSRPTAVPSVIDRIPPEMLEAVEVYVGPSETPPQYSRGGANCGAILLWTRSSR
ncbi:MAG: TonB-dependent receptor plug domain-containing protein [Gemmatimonadaceae bacterium]